MVAVPFLCTLWHNYSIIEMHNRKTNNNENRNNNEKKNDYSNAAFSRYAVGLL